MKHWIFDEAGEPITTMAGDPIAADAFGERTGLCIRDVLGEDIELSPGEPFGGDMLCSDGHYRYWEVASYDGARLSLIPVA